jgi:hypothetical protein
MASQSTSHLHLLAGHDLRSRLGGLDPILRMPRLTAVREHYVKARDTGRDADERWSAWKGIAEVDAELVASSAPQRPEHRLPCLLQCLDSYCHALLAAAQLPAWRKPSGDWFEDCWSHMQALLQDIHGVAEVDLNIMLSVRDRTEGVMAEASRLFPRLAQLRVWWHQQVCKVVVAAGLELLHGHCYKQALNVVLDGERSASIMADLLGKVSCVCALLTI